MLVSSSSGYGHLLPMVPLARALVAAGHQVLWATGPDACHLVSATGMDCRPAGLGEDEREAARRKLRAAAEDVRPHELAAYVFPRMFGGICTPRMLRDLLPIARDWQPDLLLHEQGELAAPLVADLLGVPNVTHAFGGATPEPIIAEASEHVAHLWSEHARAQPSYAGCYRYLYIDICPPSVQTGSLAHIPGPQLLRPVPYSGEEPDNLPARIDAADERPLVYITLGTVHRGATVFRDALDGVASLDVRVLVTVGPQGDPTVLEPLPAHVSVQRYVSQTAVLPHTTAVVSHAGSGTVFATLAHGLPQVCLPQAADQFRNAEGVTRSGAGLAIAPGEATADAISAAVKRVLAEATFRRAAGSVRNEIEAMPAPHEVVARLEALIA